MRIANKILWIVWGGSAVALSGYLALTLDSGADRSVFLPGATTDGHFQIELACTACHGDAFSGPEVMQQKCEACHLAALDEARDSHPKSKFTDPRNADRTALLDARFCVTCHVEHRPERTQPMGLTIPEDYCVLCHAQIGDERPTHAGLGFESCASAGCHNFHDNRSIYEDFLLRHADAPALLTRHELPARNFASIASLLSSYPKDRYPLTALARDDSDMPDAMSRDSNAELIGSVVADWSSTAHAANGVNCTACHGENDNWVDEPGYDSCGGCHVDERARFVQGRHGMRLDLAQLGMALAPMAPGEARLPMKGDVATAELDCGSCHGAHRFDTQYAAVEACLGCHDDQHSRSYIGSPHHELLVTAAAGDAPPEAAVTCASCHMPRSSKSYDYGAYVHVLVDHNQSDNLRPNEKMIRSVCLECHGLGFSIDALADEKLIERNFDDAPSVHVSSIDFALERRRAVDEERQRVSEGGN